MSNENKNKINKICFRYNKKKRTIKSYIYYINLIAYLNINYIYMIYDV